MLIAATIDWATALPITLGIIGLAGVIFTALKFNSDRATASVDQASAVLADMRQLNDALHTRINDLEHELEQLHNQLDTLTQRFDNDRR